MLNENDIADAQEQLRHWLIGEFYTDGDNQIVRLLKLQSLIENGHVIDETDDQWLRIYSGTKAALAACQSTTGKKCISGALCKDVANCYCDTCTEFHGRIGSRA